MSDCCNIKTEKEKNRICSYCHEKGKTVEIITVKSLLKPDAMKRLNTIDGFAFCRTNDCPVIYFNRHQNFMKSDITVRVFQKEHKKDVPVCYCFGYTTEIIQQVLKTVDQYPPSETIQQYVKEKKCACETRNPQGSCCLGNVKSIEKETV